MLENILMQLVCPPPLAVLGPHIAGSIGWGWELRPWIKLSWFVYAYDVRPVLYIDTYAKVLTIYCDDDDADLKKLLLACLYVRTVHGTGCDVVFSERNLD